MTLFRAYVREYVAILAYLIKWTCLTIPIGLLVGSACALFLWSLEQATETRFNYPWLLYLLPVAGAGISWMYLQWGKSVEAGNNLIMEEIHDPQGGVPLRMAPLVLIGTVITHLFGGSAGREGTAVQMGGSLASTLLSYIPILSPRDIRIALMAGIAAGFGGVFGTPVAGTIFALEVLRIGSVSYAAFLPCLLSSVLADWTCTAWGIGHTHYHIATVFPGTAALNHAPLQLNLLLKVAGAAILFGWASFLFSEVVHGINQLFKKLISKPLLRPVAGGLIVIALVGISGTRDYLGLGVTSADPDAVTIVSCFREGGAETWSWLWKLIFTTITLGSGFKGGEVTPLFYIGAALGNTLADLFAAPTDLLAAIGFVAVFAGATNTPVACTFMAIELFGGDFTLYFATGCLVAYLFSGHSGIYLSQRIGMTKIGAVESPVDLSLRDTRTARELFLQELLGISRGANDAVSRSSTPAPESPDALDPSEERAE